MNPAADARRCGDGVRDDRATAPMIELATRESGTLHVELLWAQETDLVSVSVDDPATGDNFEFVVDNGSAIDAFYHPFAYAARRVDSRTAA